MNSNTFANPGRQVVQHTLNFSVFFFLCVWSVVSSLISKKIICIHRHSFKLWLDLCSSHFKDMPFRRVHTYIGLVSFLWSVKMQSKRYFFSILHFSFDKSCFRSYILYNDYLLLYFRLLTIGALLMCSIIDCQNLNEQYRL